MTPIGVYADPAQSQATDDEIATGQHAYQFGQAVQAQVAQQQADTADLQQRFADAVNQHISDMQSQQGQDSAGTSAAVDQHLADSADPSNDLLAQMPGGTSPFSFSAFRQAVDQHLADSAPPVAGGSTTSGTEVPANPNTVPPGVTAPTRLLNQAPSGISAPPDSSGGPTGGLTFNGTYYQDPNFNSNVQRYGQEVAKYLGPQAGEFAIAQARLETGNGSALSTPYNYGNVGNTDSNPKGGGRYGSPEEAANAWVNFITNNGGPTRYQQFVNLAQQGADIPQLASAIKAAGYATDPDYAAKIAAIAAKQPSSIAPAQQGQSGFAENASGLAGVLGLTPPVIPTAMPATGAGGQGIPDTSTPGATALLNNGARAVAPGPSPSDQQTPIAQYNQQAPDGGFQQVTKMASGDYNAVPTRQPTPDQQTVYDAQNAATLGFTTPDIGAPLLAGNAPGAQTAVMSAPAAPAASAPAGPPAVQRDQLTAGPDMGTTGQVNQSGGINFGQVANLFHQLGDALAGKAAGAAGAVVQGVRQAVGQNQDLYGNMASGGPTLNSVTHTLTAIPGDIFGAATGTSAANGLPPNVIAPGAPSVPTAVQQGVQAAVNEAQAKEGLANEGQGFGAYQDVPGQAIANVAAELNGHTGSAPLPPNTVAPGKLEQPYETTGISKIPLVGGALPALANPLNMIAPEAKGAELSEEAVAAGARALGDVAEPAIRALGEGAVAAGRDAAPAAAESGAAAMNANVASAPSPTSALAQGITGSLYHATSPDEAMRIVTDGVTGQEVSGASLSSAAAGLPVTPKGSILDAVSNKAGAVIEFGDPAAVDVKRLGSQPRDSLAPTWQLTDLRGDYTNGIKSVTFNQLPSEAMRQQLTDLGFEGETLPNGKYQYVNSAFGTAAGSAPSTAAEMANSATFVHPDIASDPDFQQMGPHEQAAYLRQVGGQTAADGRPIASASPQAGYEPRVLPEAAATPKVGATIDRLTADGVTPEAAAPAAHVADYVATAPVPKPTSGSGPNPMRLMVGSAPTNRLVAALVGPKLDPAAMADTVSRSIDGLLAKSNIPAEVTSRGILQFNAMAKRSWDAASGMLGAAVQKGLPDAATRARIVTEFNDPAARATWAPQMNLWGQMWKNTSDRMFTIAKQAGVLDDYLDEYMARLAQKPLAGIPGGASLTDFAGAAMQRKLDTYADFAQAVRDKGWEPVTDLADVMAAHVDALGRAVENAKTVDYAKNFLEKDGRPTIWDPAQGPAPADYINPKISGLEKYVYRGPLENTEGIKLGAVPMKVHPDAVRAFQDFVPRVLSPAERAYLGVQRLINWGIMYNPLVHGKNVFGPAMAGSTWPNALTMGNMAWRQGMTTLRGNPEDVLSLIRNGLDTTANRQARQELFDSLIKQRPDWATTVHDALENAPLLGGARKFSDDLLWNKMVQPYQVGTAVLLRDALMRGGAGRAALPAGVSDALARMPGVRGLFRAPLDKDAAERVASEVANTIFGQIPRESLTPAQNYYGQMLLFAKNWTVGLARTARTAVGVPIPVLGRSAWQLSAADNATAAELMRSYITRFALMAGSQHIALNYLLSGQGPWDNAPLHKTDVAVRGSDGQMHYYDTGMYKQLQDALGLMGFIPAVDQAVDRAPQNVLGNRISPVIGAAENQRIGGYVDRQGKTVPFKDGLERALDVVSSLTPFASHQPLTIPGLVGINERKVSAGSSGSRVGHGAPRLPAMRR